MIIDFIKYFVPFTNSEIRANFEQDLIAITNSTIPMGLREAILEDVKKQGIELGIEQGLEQGLSMGEAKREEELLIHAIPQLLQDGDSPEKIALIFNLPLARIEEIIAKLTNLEE